jgi:hypothetical protein
VFCYLRAIASLPVAYRLYLPQEWAQDRQRLRLAGVPEDIHFQTKHEIALDQLRWACAAGLPHGTVLLDRSRENLRDFWPPAPQWKWYVMAGWWVSSRNLNI